MNMKTEADARPPICAVFAGDLVAEFMGVVADEHHRHSGNQWCVSVCPHFGLTDSVVVRFRVECGELIHTTEVCVTDAFASSFKSGLILRSYARDIFSKGTARIYDEIDNEEARQ